MRSRWVALWAVVLSGALFGALSEGPVGAAISRSAPRLLAVSVPPGVTSIAPGTASTVPVRIINAGPQAISVTMSERGIVLGNDGKARLTVGPDPLWRHQIVLPNGYIPIPPRSYVTVPVTVRLPAHISPDLYFIGFLVTPKATSVQGINVVNQIGSFVTINVPGPRLRKLSAILAAPNFTFGTTTQGSVLITNVGHAAAQFWGENDTTSAPFGGVPSQQRIDTSLLPLRAARSFTVTAKPAWLIGIVTMKIHLVYPYLNANATNELSATQRVLVVTPAGAVLLAVLFLASCFALMYLRRRRARHRLRFAG